MTLLQAINWIKAQINKWIDVDGAYGAQCVDLIMKYMLVLANFLPRGNAIDYMYNALPTGWKRFKKGEGQIQEGDIAIWKWGVWDKYGHVGLVFEVNGRYITSVEQNVDGAAVGVGGYARVRTRDDSCLVGFIRPAYSENGWVKNDTGWWYDLGDGDYFKDCWKLINGSWFRFNERGYALENQWYHDEANNRWYWLTEGGYMASKAWKFINGKWYYFREDGVMKTGWIEYQGHWYYLNNENGDMISEEYRKIGDYWYLFNKDGEMQTNKKMEIKEDGTIKMID